jgi:hypothetical protein
MFDKPAAIEAARKVLDEAPTIDGSDRPIFSISDLVDAVLAAANSDALIVPAYDHVIAPHAWYPLLYARRDTVDLPSASVRITASDKVMSYGDVVDVGMVEISLRLDDAGDTEVTTGMLRADGAWHVFLTGLAAANESHRIREAKG